MKENCQALYSGDVSTEELNDLNGYSESITNILDVLSLSTSNSTMFTENVEALQKQKKMFDLYTELCTYFATGYKGI